MLFDITGKIYATKGQLGQSGRTVTLTNISQLRQLRLYMTLGVCILQLTRMVT